MRIPTLALLLGFGLGATAQARAAEPEAGDPMGTPAVKHFDFEDDEVEGAIQRPDGDLIDVTLKARHQSLIEIRRNFIPEILKSLEDLG